MKELVLGLEESVNNVRFSKVPLKSLFDQVNELDISIILKTDLHIVTEKKTKYKSLELNTFQAR